MPLVRVVGHVLSVGMKLQLGILCFVLCEELSEPGEAAVSHGYATPGSPDLLR